MTSLTVRLDDKFVIQRTQRARKSDVSPDELVQQALAKFFGQSAATVNEQPDTLSAERKPIRGALAYLGPGPAAEDFKRASTVAIAGLEARCQAGHRGGRPGRHPRHAVTV